MILQAIEAAIELNLGRVEAGAQGEHKIQRGYMPETTYSCHYILDEDFRKAISDFLVREQAQVIIRTIYEFVKIMPLFQCFIFITLVVDDSSQLELVMKSLRESGPFKDNVV